MFSVLVSGQERAPITLPAPSCACNPTHSDPIEEPKSFHFGKFEGLCIDSCRFRPAKILNKTAQTVHVGNVFHSGSFYSTQIPLQKITGAEIGFEEFAPGVYHVFLKFHLHDKAPALALKAQPGSPKINGGIRSIVISAEGVPPKGHNYSLFEGYLQNYLFIIRAITGEEMNSWVTKHQHPVKFFPLKVSSEQAAGILKRGLEESQNKGAGTIYRLFTNNCSTAALSLIDKETGYSMAPGLFNWNKFETALPIMGPIGTLRALSTRKILDKL